MRAGILTAVMVFGLTSACFAQAPAAPQAQQEAVKTIFDFQKEVGLSDKQVAEMKKLSSDLQATLVEKAKELGTLRENLAGMIKTKKEVPVIRKQMQKIADLQVDNSCLDIEVSRKIEGVMTAAQLAKWKDIQKKFMEEIMAAQAAAQAAAQPAPAAEVPAQK